MHSGTQQQHLRDLRGFSLVEVLVVIAIVTVLLALLLPAIAHVRQMARQTQSLSNLRGLGVMFSQYADTYRCYPFVPPGTVLPGLPAGYPEIPFSFAPHWNIERYWQYTMHDFAPWPEHFETWISPGLRRIPGRPWLDDPTKVFQSNVGPSYMYSNSFVGQPAIWRGQLEVGDSAISCTTPAGVVHPSGKVLMYDADRAYLIRDPTSNTPRPVLMADGSAAPRKDVDASAPVQNALRSDPPRRYHDTPNGIAGRDF